MVDIFSSDERMPDYTFYRNLWWDKGELSEKAKWEEVTLPYVPAEEIDIEEYERRTENFNIYGCWEWVEGKIVIYEFSSMPHEVGTRDRNRGKGTDASFRPKKPAVTAPNGRSSLAKFGCGSNLCRNIGSKKRCATG
ncbi:3023_t:CDS:2 [Acaulospora colombiana]|uniref:3023_t:CDS:1 n=1 Tax=Acaulospora colombiana TaxID=27376 RepID=A0ACA9L715_9GLOM|nr:3023_t:CDS:2 [Acaulospora colombiana]